MSNAVLAGCIFVTLVTCSNSDLHQGTFASPVHVTPGEFDHRFLPTSAVTKREINETVAAENQLEKSSSEVFDMPYPKKTFKRKEKAWAESRNSKHERRVAETKDVSWSEDSTSSPVTENRVVEVAEEVLATKSDKMTGVDSPNVTDSSGEDKVSEKESKEEPPKKKPPPLPTPPDFVEVLESKIPPSASPDSREDLIHSHRAGSMEGYKYNFNWTEIRKPSN